MHFTFETQAGYAVNGLRRLLVQLDAVQGRASWLEWRAAWRSVYASLSQTIRQTKPKRAPGFWKRATLDPSYSTRAQAACLSMRRVAREMMALRQLAKLKVQDSVRRERAWNVVASVPRAEIERAA